MSWILEIFKMQCGGSDPSVAKPSMTPFETELLGAFKSGSDGDLALLVKLVPDDKGTISFHDEAYDCDVKCRYEFETVLCGQNPYSRIDDLNYEGEPVVIALDLRKGRIEMQMKAWLAYAIQDPAEFVDDPVISLPKREAFETDYDRYVRFINDARGMANRPS